MAAIMLFNRDSVISDDYKTTHVSKFANNSNVLFFNCNPFDRCGGFNIFQAAAKKAMVANIVDTFIFTNVVF